MHRITIPIGGMSCGGCVRSVQEALRRVPGVQIEKVTIGSATLSYDPSVTDRDEIIAAIARAGYAPRATWLVEGRQAPCD